MPHAELVYAYPGAKPLWQMALHAICGCNMQGQAPGQVHWAESSRIPPTQNTRLGHCTRIETRMGKHELQSGLTVEMQRCIGGLGKCGS
ncbi:hypothetical protein L1887_49512 [Cichorium endivia]|nr:hypothetical protein L1887_49512 [Cichorium endivia]